MNISANANNANANTNTNACTLPVCTLCNLDGHTNKYCTLIKGLYCSKCTSFGHNYSICPERKLACGILQVINQETYIKSFLISKNIPCNGFRLKRLRETVEKYAKMNGINEVHWIVKPFVERPKNIYRE
jgi:hypothetical protein